MEKNHGNVTAMIVAAGQGKRMGTETAKQFLQLKGKEILAHTVACFEASSAIDEIILVVGKDTMEDVQKLQRKYDWKKIVALIQGGAERGDSVVAGLGAVSAETEILLIHDGVRPFVNDRMISDCIQTARTMGACAVGVLAKDTIKVCNEQGFVLDTPKRSSLWQVQTPQAFSFSLIKQAYAKAQGDGFSATDDTAVVEHFGQKVKMIQGDYKNIKITTQEDLLIANCFLEEGNS